MSLLFSLLLACTGAVDTDETGPSVPTGWFDESDLETGPDCEAVFSTSSPEADESGWYWRDALTAYVAEADEAAYALTVSRAGVDVAVDASWDDTSLALTVLPTSGAWEASSTYTVQWTDCSGERSWSFSTGSLGEALEVDNSELMGRTFAIDLTDATWVEPGGFGAVLGLFFDTSILLGVEYADATYLDLLGGQGWQDDFGEYTQYTSEPTWDFPIADFTQTPYFLATSDEVTISFSGVDVPVTDFRLSGTFAASGDSLGGGTIAGLGDTRYMGVLVEQEDDPAAMCELASTLGAECEACPDGEPYCLYLYAKDIEAPWAPGLELVAVEDDG